MRPPKMVRACAACRELFIARRLRPAAQTEGNPRCASHPTECDKQTAAANAGAVICVDAAKDTFGLTGRDWKATILCAV